MADTSVATEISRGPCRVEITCPIEFHGPLHTGTGERLSVVTDAPVLRYPDGAPALTGASVRGVMRDWCEREAPLHGISPQIIERLFGVSPDGKQATGDRQGRLTVLDARLSDADGAEIRDHVRIDPKYGSAARGAKFDQEVVYCKHADLVLIYEGDDPEDEELELLQLAVDGLREGLLAFGGKTGWGYGWARPRVQEKTPWPQIRAHRRHEPAGLLAYLNGHRNGDEAALEALPLRRINDSIARVDQEPRPWSWLRLDLELQFDGPMLVAGPDRGKVEARDKPPDDVFFAAVTNPEKPILPGSSLRGALRSYADRIANSLDGMPANEKNPAPFQRLSRRLFGFADDSKDKGIQGLARIGDGSIAPDSPTETVWMDHVAIDRITGFAAKGKLFNALALASPRFAVPIMLRWHDDEEDRAAVALFLFALRDADDGALWVGSRTTRGYGHLTNVTISRARHSIVGAGGRSKPVDLAVREIRDLGSDPELKRLLESWTTRVEALQKGKQ